MAMDEVTSVKNLLQKEVALQQQNLLRSAKPINKRIPKNIKMVGQLKLPESRTKYLFVTYCKTSVTVSAQYTG